MHMIRPLIPFFIAFFFLVHSSRRTQVPYRFDFNVDRKAYDEIIKLRLNTVNDPEAEKANPGNLIPYLLDITMIFYAFERDPQEYRAESGD